MTTTTPPSAGTTPTPDGRAGLGAGPGAGPGDDLEQDGTRQPAWVVVAGREVLVKLTDRNFVVTTIVTLVLLAGSFGLQVLLGGGTDEVRAVASGPQSRQVLEQVGQLAGQRGESMTVTVTDAASADAVTQAVRDKGADVGLVHDGTTWRLVGNDTPDAGLTALVREAVSSRTLATNAAAAGTSVEALTAGSAVSVDVLDPSSDTAVSYIVALAFAFLFYLASLLFGMTIASSVVEEKQSRVVEILVSAVPVRQLLVGKVAGNTLLALAQMVAFVGVGLVGLSFTSYRTLLPSLAGASGWFLVFFLAGFVALACLWAVAGSLATRNEDLQSTTPVLTTLLIATMMIGLLGKGLVLTVASYVPVVSTVAMPIRLFQGEASWWEPVLSLLVTLAFAAAAVVVGERLYRRTVLQTQRRMSLREALKAEG